MLFFSHPVSVVSCRVVSKRKNLAQSNGFLKQELAGTLDTAVNLRRGIQIQYFISLCGFVTLLPPFFPPLGSLFALHPSTTLASNAKSLVYVLAMIPCLSSSLVFFSCALFRQNFCLEKVSFSSFPFSCSLPSFFLVSRLELTIYVLRYSSIEIFTCYILVCLV